MKALVQKALTGSVSVDGNIAAKQAPDWFNRSKARRYGKDAEFR